MVAEAVDEGEGKGEEEEGDPLELAVDDFFESWKEEMALFEGDEEIPVGFSGPLDVGEEKSVDTSRINIMTWTKEKRSLESGDIPRNLREMRAGDDASPTMLVRSSLINVSDPRRYSNVAQAFFLGLKKVVVSSDLSRIPYRERLCFQVAVTEMTKRVVGSTIFEDPRGKGYLLLLREPTTPALLATFHYLGQTALRIAGRDMISSSLEKLLDD
jgi:hypothetical protein